MVLNNYNTNYVPITNNDLSMYGNYIITSKVSVNGHTVSLCTLLYLRSAHTYCKEVKCKLINQ